MQRPVVIKFFVLPTFQFPIYMYLIDFSIGLFVLLTDPFLAALLEAIMYVHDQ